MTSKRWTSVENVELRANVATRLVATGLATRSIGCSPVHLELH